jgi:pimeloyl-ACP methyl ester carboxylesterase
MSTPVEAEQLRVDIRKRGVGGGLPLVLLPGIGASLDLYEGFRTAVGERETVGIDPPGSGGSPVARWPMNMAGFADACVAALDRHGIERFDLLGLSWGGALAQELTLRHPGRVRRLVLIATMYGPCSVPGHPLAVSILATPWRYYSPSYLRAVAPLLYGGAIRSDPSLLERQTYLRHRHAPNPIGYAHQLLAVSMWSSRHRLGRISQPTLVMAADDDPIINVANATTMVSLLADGRLHLVAGGGHLFLITSPEYTAAVVSEFLDDDEERLHPNRA